MRRPGSRRTRRDLDRRRDHLAAIRPDADPAEADWWKTSWDGRTPPAVGFLIPADFEAYARVLHPAHDRERDAVRWATVAEECGTVLHPGAQWHRLAGGRDHDPRGLAPEPRRWPGNEPDVGRLPRPDFRALAEVLGRHTTTPDDSVVAFWDGYGCWPAAWRDLPLARTPGRDHVLFRRPVAQVEHLCADAPAVAHALGETHGALAWSSDGTVPSPTADELLEAGGAEGWQSPTLWWPGDRAWASSNDTDLDSTLVAGSRALVDDLLADQRLEALAWPVGGSLWSDADTVNR